MLTRRCEANEFKMYTLLIIFTLPLLTNALYAYECTTKDLNYTSISLLKVDKCPEYKVSKTIDPITIQVLQEREVYPIHIYQCAVEIHYHATYCGQGSHASEMQNGWGTTLWPMSASECRDLHRTRELHILGKNIYNLKRNATTTQFFTVAGSIDANSACTSGQITIGHLNFNNALVTVNIEVKLYDNEGIYRVEDRLVITNSGLTCPYKDRSCLDALVGYVTWDEVESTDCSETAYQQLYYGKADKVYVSSSLGDHDDYILYSIRNDVNFLATLIHKGEKTICGITTVITDHPKLIIQEITNGITYFKPTDIIPQNMDIFLYVNAKFTHLENHMRTEMANMYEVIVKEQCETKRAALETQLALAAIDPVEFAYIFTGKEGHSALVMGETVHIIQCSPVVVSVARIEGCYQELPVNSSGRIMYMAPKTHILQTHGTPVLCTMMLKPSFKLNGQWYDFENGLHEIKSPKTLHPTMQLTWKYHDAGNLARDGIYSSEDVTKLKNQLMYPVERKALTQTLSAYMNNDVMVTNFDALSSLVTEERLKSTFEHFVSDSWQRFLTFGSIFSGIFGIMLIFKLIKLLFDTVIHSRGLYEVYGCGWQMMASIWDAATTYLLSPVRVSQHQTRHFRNDETQDITDLQEQTYLQSKPLQDDFESVVIEQPHTL
ncbi:hypothetical protein [Dendrolimus punctatus cypovirus 22]|uniref:hypothetical protein n=1 Tax=Dendrolimus punctatus cypovirus 22 TaxID=1577776 RepID=UPI00053FB2F4|nr:hypothetical protein [Dendrolimus punctatus cypovirus 22]AIY60601.1 hypothetical protein [Dendrolimus punctatus cypovirus 22]